MARANLLLHPVRLRILKAFVGDRALTTGQLAAEMPDIPAGTLYRHVERLADAGVNLELLLPVQVSRDEFFAVVCVDDVDAARAALGVVEREQCLGASDVSRDQHAARF